MCILRLEEQPDGLLISLSLIPDVGAERVERRRTFVSVDDAVRAVDEFIRTFESGPSR